MYYKILFSLLRGFGVCLLFLSPAYAFLFTPVNSNPGTNSIYLSYDGTQNQADLITINVRVNTLSISTPAIGAAFDLDFNPSVLTYDSLLPGDFFERGDLAGNGSMVRLSAMQQGMPGKLLIGISQNYGDPGASGSGILLTLKFRVASGSQILQSNLSFSNMNLISLQRQLIAGLNWYGGQAVQSPLEITTASVPPEATQGLSLTFSLTASGGFPPYTWSQTSGNMPPGLQLNTSTGVISGTPSTPGAYSVTIRLRDSLLQEVSRTFNTVINPAPQILASSLPGGSVNQAYNQTLSASGGTAPLTWDLSSGALPPGIALNSATGLLSGTPTASGTTSFTVRLRDFYGAVATKPLSITVNQGVSISTAILPETTAGAVYSAALQVQGGAAPYTWTIASGLPPGLSLISTTGEILGIASTAGNYTFTATVRDLSNASATKALVIMVYPAPAIATTSVNNLYQGSAGQGVIFTATGGISPYTWSVTAGSLPAGLTLDTQTGTVSGSPTTPGIYAFTIRVTDALGIASSTPYQWVILATPPGNVDFTTPGSVNRVDGYDLITLDMAFGTTAGSPGWNPLADLNGDGIIDDADFSILEGNFGKSNGL